MTYRVVILQSAEQDLKDLRSYIRQNFSEGAWQESYAKIKESVRSLGSFPLAGTVPEEIERLHLTQFRQVVVGRNRLIYEIRQSTIFIHAVVDHRRDLKSFLLQRLLRTS